MINSYGSVYALGHKAVADILDHEVEASEKVDGSQISFGMIDGELIIRSKNQQVHVGGNNGMFDQAVASILDLAPLLTANWIYRGEYLQKPKHNALCYSRVPRNNIIIYDIEAGIGTEHYVPWQAREIEAGRIGLEAVPVYHHGAGLTLDRIKELLNHESILGGVNIEGVVVKDYNTFTDDKKVAKAKFVSPAFKEKHEKEWGAANPSAKDIISQLIDVYRHEGRWQKAVQHLRDDGVLEGSPRDIGNLMKAAQQDLIVEEADAIKDVLFKHYISQITRGAIRGLPEWYKDQLAQGNIE